MTSGGSIGKDDEDTPSAELIDEKQLAATTGQTIEQLRAWEALGLVTRSGEMFAPDAVDRVRLLAYAAQRGVHPQAIADASTREPDILSRYVELVGGRGRVLRSVDHAAAQVALDPAFVRRLVVAGGLGQPDGLSDEDVEMLRIGADALRAGLPAEAVLQMARVYNDALSRVAEAEARLVHFYVHEPLEAQGLAGEELAAAYEEAGEALLGLIEPAVISFHRKGLDAALRDDLVVHLAEDVGQPPGAVGQTTLTVLFVDLASFTVMTEVMGDSTAAAVVERFSDLVRAAAGSRDGRVLKQIGDEFMLVFRDSRAAVGCGIAIMASVSAEPQFPEVRLGAHTGTALFREGDYLGATVNIAARVASQAGPDQFLVTDAVRVAVGASEDWFFEPIGRHALKNVAKPTELLEVRPRTGVTAGGERGMPTGPV